MGIRDRAGPAAVQKSPESERRDARPADDGGRVMDARLQRRIQRDVWDHAVDFYHQHWMSQVLPATQGVLERAAIEPGDRVLDVACGTGVLAIAAATAVGNDGSVIGIDLSGKMVCLLYTSRCV